MIRPYTRFDNSSTCYGQTCLSLTMALTTFTCFPTLTTVAKYVATAPAGVTYDFGTYNTSQARWSYLPFNGSVDPQTFPVLRQILCSIDLSTLATSTQIGTLATSSQIGTLATSSQIGTLATSTQLNTLATSASVSTLATQLTNLSTQVSALQTSVNANAISFDPLISLLIIISAFFAFVKGWNIGLARL